MTGTVPALPGGTVAVMVVQVEFTVAEGLGLLPNVTDSSPQRLVPVIVIVPPPLGSPLVGEELPTVGGPVVVPPPPPPPPPCQYPGRWPSTVPVRGSALDPFRAP